MRTVTRSATTPSTARRPIPRGKHVVDQALDVAHAVHHDTPSLKERRERRKALQPRYGSKGRISVLEQLGLTLATLPPLEIEVYRSPRITWRLIQRLVRKDTPSATVIRALRDAIAVPPRDGRRHRPKRGTPRRSPSLGDSAFDPAAAAENPLAYLSSELDSWSHRIGAPLRALINQQLADQTAAHLGNRGIHDVGQSLSSLMATLQSRRSSTHPNAQSPIQPPAYPPTHELALRMLKRIADIQQLIEQTISAELPARSR